MEKNNRLRVGSIVRVTHRDKLTGKNKGELAMDFKPTIGRVVFVGMGGKFYIVEFRDRYTAEYKPMYRQSFWPEQLERIHQPNFIKTRPAKKRAWAQ